MRSGSESNRRRTRNRLTDLDALLDHTVEKIPSSGGRIAPRSSTAGCSWVSGSRRGLDYCTMIRRRSPNRSRTALPPTALELPDGVVEVGR